MQLLEEGLSTKGDQSEKMVTRLIQWLKSAPENKNY
jgi:hypothetical protein